MVLKNISRLLLFVFLLVYTSGHACDVPVFKYAMEFWDTDPYDVYIFHEGALSPGDEKAVRVMQDAAGFDYGQMRANINVYLVDLSGDIDAEERSLWEEQNTGDIPWMAVYYPMVHARQGSVWAGRLNAMDAERILFSPKRGELAKRLLSGESAVWILLESGNRSKDNAVAAMLEKELKRLEKTLRLPDAQTWGWAGPAGDITAEAGEADSRISFSLLRLASNDAVEKMMVRMLLKSEDDLEKFHGEPMVFPVYGRGLILYALVGRGINEWTINEAGEFLTGPCSCLVKASNPGIDMLMHVNWQERTGFDAAESVPPLTGVSEFIARADRAGELAALENDEAEKVEIYAGDGKNIPEEETNSGLADKEGVPEMVLPEDASDGEVSGNLHFLIKLAAGIFLLAAVISSVYLFRKK